MSEQQSQTTATAVQTTSACPHPEAVGQRWGDPISEERQAELQGYLDRWAAETDHGERKGPFDSAPGQRRVRLTGADVFWLAEQSGRDEYGGVPNLHLQGAAPPSPTWRPSMSTPRVTGQVSLSYPGHHLTSTTSPLLR